MSEITTRLYSIVTSSFDFLAVIRWPPAPVCYDAVVSPALRRMLFSVHMWVGLISGLYIFVVCLTGAALVFRIDLQRLRHPHLFTPTAAGPPVDPVGVMDRVSRAYPDHRLSGVEAPTSLRPTYLAYVTKGREFVTVLIDPVTAGILGEMPEDPFITAIQKLHFDLMGGRTGRTVNGIGAGCILVMCATGLVIWWPGRKQWMGGFIVRPGRDGRHIVWELHRAVGVSSVLFLAMVAITALSFVFPANFRAVVNAISPLTVSRAPVSGPPRPDESRPAWPDVIARARQERPGQHVARVVMPSTDRAAFLIMFSSRSPTPAGSGLSSVHLDQYSGQPLAAPRTARTAGDVLMAWVTPLHVGGFGIEALRWAWFAFGLAPAVLFVTGVTMWWRRVVRPRRPPQVDRSSGGIA